MKDPEISKYLGRIGLDDCNCDLDGLTMLQERHMETIPFENLDIVVGRKIALDYPHLFDKIVIKYRGGNCFELNLLYAELMKSLGFAPRPVLGRVWLSNPKSTPPRNHLAHIVEVEGRTYITDVGFAGLITRVPLDINESSPVNDTVGMVKIFPFTDHQYMIQRQSEKGWDNLYSFENVEISEEDISISNYYMSTNPQSHLFYHKCIGRNTKEGRIGLFNNKLSIRKGTKVVENQRVDYGADWIVAIKNEFSITLDYSEKEFKDLFEKKLIVT